MKDALLKERLKSFSKQWNNRGYEKGETQPFWLELLGILLDMDATDFIRFEEQVHLDNTSFMDGYIDATHVLIEQKSLGKNLSSSIRQSDGTMLTPFQQAKRYAADLPYSKRPRWIVTCNFAEFYVYDMENPNAEAQVIKLKNLESEYYRLSFLTDTESEHLKKELQISKDAGELVGKLYDAFYEQYIKVRELTEKDYKSLNILCVRLVFCFYAEDAGLFGKRDAFRDFISSYDTNHLRAALIDLFKVLNTPDGSKGTTNERDPFLDEALQKFPYCNGGLFSDETITIPQVNEKIRSLIIQSSAFDWNEISPTIFGACFESTLNPETRRSGGMHYTSVENIHKVIDPLFLNDLKEELETILDEKIDKKRLQLLDEYQNKLSSLKFLDPACGSGNFLTETYLSLRKLENRVITEKQNNQITMGAVMDPIKVSIQQFYGIEINDFAVSVAMTALWIAEAQMMEKTKAIVDNSHIEFLPLETFNNIREGNALRMDWEDIISNEKLNYIIGNPPFVGYKYQSREQKKDIADIFGDVKTGKIDYVTCWYMKAARLMGKNESIRAALVSTNSICQGEMIETVWEPLMKSGVHIDFAYRTFVWNSEASDKAHVHCVIIGFSRSDNKKYYIFEDTNVHVADNINPYLVDAANVFVKARKNQISHKPLMHMGVMARDGGYLILSDEEYKDYIEKEPQGAKFIHRYMMGREFINNIDRYCFWMVDANPADVKKCPLLMKRIEQVKQYRMESVTDATRKFADTPSLFCQLAQPTNDFIAFPKVSSQQRRYIPIGFLNKDVIVGDKIYVVENVGLYEFGILASNVHNAWMRVVAGRLKSDYSYSNTIVYNNFPWPNPTDEQKVKIESTAQGILDARANYPNASLADLYDELTMPVLLRKAHQANDKAVWEAYGKAWDIKSESECVACLMKEYQRLTENQK